MTFESHFNRFRIKDVNKGAFVISVIALLMIGADVVHAESKDQIDTLLPQPPPPALTAIPGAKSQAHSDCVRITYVSPKGETTASLQAIYASTASTLTVVHSPPAEHGALGYNIYAAKAGECGGRIAQLQNVKPLAIGTDYTEDEKGWLVSKVFPPTANTAVIPLPETTVELTQSGGYFEAPLVDGAVAAVLLPSNDSRRATKMSLGAATGLPSGLPGPSANSQNDPIQSTVVRTIRLKFSSDITLGSIPAFKLTLPRGITPAGPFLLQLYDGETKTLLDVVPGCYLRNLTFLSDYRKKFHAIANRPYYAELIANSSSAATFPVSGSPATLTLPSAAGVTLSAQLPAATNIFGSATIFASASPPVGLPPLVGPAVKRSLYFATVTLSGTATYPAPVTLTATLPDSFEGAEHVRLAAYDSASKTDWSVPIAPTRISGRTLTFELSLPSFLAWRVYGIALYASDERTAVVSADKPRRSKKSQLLRGSHRISVYVLGESASLLTLLPPTKMGCVQDWGPLPDCQYSDNPQWNWPGVLAEITHYHVTNFASLGTETVVNTKFGESMLGKMVPHIPSDADVVVCQCGVFDLELNNYYPETSSRATIITNAILKRAPHARIVYVGIRCVVLCKDAGIAAWNAAFRELAKKYGAFVDLISIAPPGASASFPDAGHPTRPIARLIATRVSDAIHSLHLASR